ncbi:hypothetical protein [Bradyrhizobium sp. AUGA SZCCT0283]|uniref:hypothetical protein n=1 Tax=Bradyrhizobium sp. AUGA SZCCT0283 TaxID=2807671 RepID=UPI002896450C|nr:hypothetical protein [Bradyrhizobium sp. AUGA SZCCT0283]
MNPASFTSPGIIGTIKAFEGPVREVHVSHVHGPDECHRHSAIDSRSDRGAYFSSGGYDPLLAPLHGVR